MAEFDIRHPCGHTETIGLDIPAKARDRKLGWLQRIPCPDCLCSKRIGSPARMNSHGEIWGVDGRVVGYFEYSGADDRACTRVYRTFDGVCDNWRGDNNRDCSCHRPRERVLLWTAYGETFFWFGEVCWNCMAITAGFTPFTEDGDLRVGHPFRAREVAPHAKAAGSGR